MIRLLRLHHTVDFADQTVNNCLTLARQVHEKYPLTWLLLQDFEESRRLKETNNLDNTYLNTCE